jgi:trans-aconitate methyltransferase
MGVSLIYRSRIAYELVMLALYRSHYADRYEAIANLIPRGAEVLELCCGPGILYDRYLRSKNVRYRGLDSSKNFVSDLVRRGITAEQWDVRSSRPLPHAECVVMQASLYHFLPNAAPVVDRMLGAAEKEVIIAEPIRNLASSKVPIIARLSRNLTDPGAGSSAHRFVEATLDQLAERYGSLLRHSFLAPGGREKIYVFNKVTAAVA